MWNPLSWVMEAAAIMAIALANGGVSAQLLGFFCLLSVKSRFVFYFLELLPYILLVNVLNQQFLSRESPLTGKILWVL